MFSVHAKLVPSWLRVASRPTRRLITRATLRVRSDAKLSARQRFIRDGYGDLLIKNLAVGEAGTAIDFGGYVGDWTALMLREYGCRVLVFEPVPAFVRELKTRFDGDSRVVVHPCGIGSEAGSRTFRQNQDGTGRFADGSEIAVRFESAEYLSQCLPDTVEVVCINIEGGEYELIPALHALNLLERLDLIFVQFHRVSDLLCVEQERVSCQEILAQTHKLKWSYDFIWEAWERR